MREAAAVRGVEATARVTGLRAAGAELLAADALGAPAAS